MNIVNVEHVTKRYPSFTLDDVSFTLTYLYTVFYLKSQILKRQHPAR